MSDFRPVRSLIRGLDVLRTLNRLDGATVTEVASETQLSRGTVYRMLETLGGAGYVFRDNSDGRYRLTLQVRDLSDGFSDATWVPNIAKPMIEKLCARVMWPISISTCSGTAMLLRETTDKSSPFALRRLAGGFQVPLLGSSAGRVFLAFCEPEQRQAILTVLARSQNHPTDAMARDDDFVKKILEKIRVDAYAIMSRADLKQSVLAVPVFVNNRIFATLALRYIESALSAREVLATLLTPLRDTAHGIGEACELAHGEKQLNNTN